jgi:predicted PurR-regulated permease PerM
MNQSDQGGASTDTRWERARRTAHSRDISPRTVVATVAAVGAVYLAGKVVYRLRDVLLLLAVAGFTALILNPLVVTVQRRLRVRRAFAVAFLAFGAAWYSPA